MKKILLTAIFGFGLIMNAMAEDDAVEDKIIVEYNGTDTAADLMSHNLQGDQISVANRFCLNTIPDKYNETMRTFHTYLKDNAREYLKSKSEANLNAIKKSLISRSSLFNHSVLYWISQKANLKDKFYDPMTDQDRGLEIMNITGGKKILYIQHTTDKNNSANNADDFSIVVRTKYYEDFHLSPSLSHYLSRSTHSFYSLLH